MANLIDYELFVEGKLSTPSKDFEVMIERLKELHETADSMGLRLPQIMTASDGLTAEAGEFKEIVKKIVWQGKPLDEQSLLHMRKEIGDAFFYLMVACIGLGITGDEIIEMNKDKLDARYIKGFTIEESENRVEGDL